MPKLHQIERVTEGVSEDGAVLHVDRLRVDGGWIYCFGFNGKVKVAITSQFVPDVQYTNNEK